MWKAGLTDYSEFAKSLLERITDKPISFEVVADDEEDIGRQARVISTWGSNVYVKVPVTTSTGQSLAPLVRELSEAGIKVNVTALMTPSQVDVIAHALRDGAPELRLGVRRAHRGRRGRAVADHERVARDPRVGRTRRPSSSGPARARS